MLISDKAYFRPKLKETMKVQQERLTILDIYVANICAANYIKKNIIGFKRTER
jgi:hypothetical protein